MANPRNLALFFDGTWQSAEQDWLTHHPATNVLKLKNATPCTAGQISKYISGVGVTGGWRRRTAGGMAGLGVSRNIKEGYAHLVEHYDDDTRIFLFGFSRGAYTARSLAGFVHHVGLLFKDHLARVEEAFERYKRAAHGLDLSFQQLLREVREDRRRQGLPEGVAESLRIHMIGVWDTVGRLGMPGPFGIITHPLVRFHSTELPPNVSLARQALALHELRGAFEPSLWTKCAPEQDLKQVWFAGSHCDVGGGYPDCALSDIPLAWMADEAAAAELHVDMPALQRSMHPDARGHVHHEMRWWFALGIPQVRRALCERIGIDAGLDEISEPARRRCWNAAESYPWRLHPLVNFCFRSIDALTLHIDLETLAGHAPAQSDGSAPFSALRLDDVAKTAASARKAIREGPFDTAAPRPLRLHPAASLAESLCTLFLYVDETLVKDLVAACDACFEEGYGQIVASSRGEEQHRRAKPWATCVKDLDDAIWQAQVMLKPLHPTALASEATVDGDTRHLLRRLGAWTPALKLAKASAASAPAS